MRHIPIRVTLLRSATAAIAVPILILSFLAQSVAAQSLDEIAAAVDETGRYLDGQTLEAVASDAVSRANAQDVGFVYLDQENGEDLLGIATGLLGRLDGLGSDYDTLIALDASGVYVVSDTNSAAPAAADAATPDFARGAIGGGIDTVLDILSGGSETPATTAGSDAATDAASGATTDSSAGSGGGVPWLLIFLLGAAVFLVVRFFLGRRRKAAALEAALAEDRAEIREQLRNNSDHVIDLGDRIANADDELRRIYEEAAQTFQDVSMGLDDAATAAEIDALDDRLDRAEWQFDVIEARLDGRTPPPEPRPGDDRSGSTRPGARQPVPPLGDRTPRGAGDRGESSRSAPAGRSLGDDRPALGADDSLFPGDPRSRGRRTQSRRPSRRRSGGGMLGGLAKAGVMALLMRVLLGGGLGTGNTSRRTQQRRGSYGGGIGGGVLR